MVDQTWLFFSFFFFIVPFWIYKAMVISVCVCVCRLQRLVKDLGKQLQGQDSGQWANNKVSGLDRTLGEISRILEKQVLYVEWI